MYSSETEAENAQRIVQDLCLKTKHAAQEVAAMSSRHLTPLGKGARIELEKGSTQYTLSYTRRSWKKPFCVTLNGEHYNKLRDAFLRVHRLSKRRNESYRHFISWYSVHSCAIRCSLGGTCSMIYVAAECKEPFIPRSLKCWNSSSHCKR